MKPTQAIDTLHNVHSRLAISRESASVILGSIPDEFSKDYSQVVKGDHGQKVDKKPSFEREIECSPSIECTKGRATQRIERTLPLRMTIDTSMLVVQDKKTEPLLFSMLFSNQHREEEGGMLYDW